MYWTWGFHIGGMCDSAFCVGVGSMGLLSAVPLRDLVLNDSLSSVMIAVDSLVFLCCCMCILCTDWIPIPAFQIYWEKCYID